LLTAQGTDSSLLRFVQQKAHHDAPWDAYDWVTDPVALQPELQSSGAKIIRGPEDTCYHTRRIKIEDRKGYLLCYG